MIDGQFFDILERVARRVRGSCQAHPLYEGDCDLLEAASMYHITSLLHDYR